MSSLSSRFASLLIVLMILPQLIFAQGVLTLTNQDKVPGLLMDVDEETFTWKTALTKEPLQFERESVSSIRFDVASSIEPTSDSWRIEMLNKDVLFGTLTEVSNQTLTFQSKRHETISIDRSQIYRLQKVNNPGMIYNGPTGLQGWIVPEYASALGQVYSEHELHQLSTRLPGTIFHSMDLPEKFKVDFILASTDIPRFVICFDGDDKTRGQMQLEVWKDTLVALANYNFEEVTTFRSDEHQVHLVAYVDRSARHLKMFDGNGKHLADLQVPEGPSLFTKPGILIENLKGDLTVQQLRVEHWDGTIKPLDSKNYDVSSEIPAGVRLVDIKSPEMLVFESNSEDFEQQLSQISSINLTDKLPALDVIEDHVVAWADGGILRGQIQSIHNNVATIKTPYSSLPIECRLENIERISLNTEAHQTDHLPDRAVFSSGELSGELTFHGEGNPLYWNAFGARTVSPVSLNANVLIERQPGSERHSADSQAYPDILFLNDDNILPAQVSNVDETTVRFESPFCSIKQLPANDIRAIEFSALHDPEMANNYQWKRSVGEARIAGDRIVFNANASVQHPALAHGDELQFHLSWPEAYVMLSCELFETDQPIMDEGKTKVYFNLNNRSLSVLSKLEHDAQLQGHMIRDPSAPRNYIRVKENQAVVRLVLDDGRLNVIVAGRTLSSMPLDKLGLQGHGITFSVHYPHRPEVTTTLTEQQLDQYSKEEVTISDFEVKQTKGAIVKQFIQKQSRERALFIPRFRRDNPSKHIAIAHNGDLLRGDLQILAGESLQFESKLDTLKLPKETVAAIVWLRLPPEGTEPQSPPVSPHVPSSVRFTTTDGYSVVMIPESAEAGTIRGGSPRLGDCTMPIAHIKSISIGRSDQFVRGEYVAWIPSRSPEPRWEMPDEEEEMLPAQQLIDRKMDDFELDTFDGSKFKLSSHSDKVVVLDFWASWCGPCVRAMPGYIEATSKFDPAKVALVAVNLREDEAKVREFLDVQQYPQPPEIALDRDGDISTAFRVSGIPHTVVIAPGGILKSIHIGFAEDNAEKLGEEIKKILGDTNTSVIP